MRGMRAAFWLALLAPSIAFGDLVISEVMYDLESGSDSGREWVEVFNAGTNSATLTEWKLFEGSTNHSISAHSGGETIAAGAYAVIADNPAKFLEDWPGFSGMLFDSAFSLSNSGETLILRCCSSDLLDKDSITYNGEAGGAGDGKSLHRASVASATMSAASPTPGSGALAASNGVQDTGSATTTSTSTSTTTSTTPTSSTVSSYVPPPVPKLFADAGDDVTVIAGADVEFRGRAYNREQEIVENVRFSWNFGDGTTAEGANVMHHFVYPAKYAVILNVAHNMDAVGDRIVVTAEPARLSFSVNSDGSVSIGNGSGRDLDLSLWIIKSFNQSFILPDDTILLASQTLRIPQSTLRFFALSTSAELQYPNGVAYKQTQSLPPEVPPPSVPNAPSVRAPIQLEAPLEVYVPAETEAQRETDVATSAMHAATASTALNADLGWWLSALGLAFIGAGAIQMARRAAAHEWTIVE